MHRIATLAASHAIAAPGHASKAATTVQPWRPAPAQRSFSGSPVGIGGGVPVVVPAHHLRSRGGKEWMFSPSLAAGA